MSDDLSQAISIEEPFPTEPGTEPTTDDAEPAEAVQVGDKRMVDVSVLAAERKRVREATEKRLRDELEPLKQKAAQVDQLQQALNEVRPYVDLVKQHPNLLQQREPSIDEQISDEEAAQEARELQLYDAQSQLDLKVARRIIAKRRQEAYAYGQQAAQEAIQQHVTPLRQITAEQASKQNFLAMVQATDATGNPLVDPEILAQEWVAVGPEGTQHPQIAQVVLDRAIGRMIREGKRPQAAARSPLLSEAPGGRAPGVTMTDTARKLGLTKSDLESASKTFNPGGVSEIGGW